MSELKTYDFPVDHGDFTSTVELFYLKSEADAVIAELNQKINEAQTELELWRDGSIISEVHQKELDQKRHSNYKRCLAMARWCASRSASWCFDPADDELHKSDFYEKWKLRWRELAEKFKEAK